MLAVAAAGLVLTAFSCAIIRYNVPPVLRRPPLFALVERSQGP